MVGVGVGKHGPILAGMSLVACVLLNVLYFPNSTTFNDETRFLIEAQHLVETGSFWVGGDRAWEMPGTAIFYAPFVYFSATPEAAILSIRVAQSALVALQSMLIGITAGRIFGDRRAALAALSASAFYPFFLYYQGLLFSETLFNTLLVAGIASLYWWRDRGFRLDGVLLLSCACLGAATLTKATLTVLPPILVASLTLSEARPALTIRTLVAATVIYVAMMAPWWVRNYVVLHTFVPCTTSALNNLYLGNNPKNPTAEVDWSANVETDLVQQMRAIPDEVVRQRAFADAAIRYIADDPIGFCQRMGLKFLRFWNIVPNAAEFRGLAYQVISAASFGPVLALALVVAIMWRSRTTQFIPIYLLVAYFTAIHMVTIASLRYRLPLEPFLIIMAAGIVGPAADWLRPRARLMSRLVGLPFERPLNDPSCDGHHPVNN
jgi:4-amino-4-deoxy-L-arabinose transferase-like glycosyltransferase